MTRAPMAVRRKSAHWSRTSPPSFMDKKFDQEKRTLREETANLFAQHVSRKNPQILCMPYYEALCVKAINAVLPDATFVGCEQVKHVAEMFAEAAPGKKIEIRQMRISDYVNVDIDSKRFDAAFLDYMGPISELRLNEITSFIETKLITKYIIAVTLQGDIETIQTLSEGLNSRLKSIERIYSKEYRTKSQMCHSVFVGEL